jgi:hypothetical protein
MDIIYRRIVQQTMLMTREFYAFPPGFPTISQAQLEAT